MTNKVVITIFTIALIFSLSLGFINNVQTSASGAAASPSGGHTGGSFENGRTCATGGCHTGTATYDAGLISSTIPTTGYIPGNTYDVVVTINKSGITRFGFQASPQDASGNIVGQFSSPTAGYIVQNPGSYHSITHSSGLTSGTSPKLFAFKWTAPATGQGTAYLFVAANAANNDGTNGGDMILFDTLVVEQAAGTGVDDLFAEYAQIHIFPGHTGHYLHINIEAHKVSDITFSVYDMNGRRLTAPKNLQNISGTHKEAMNISGFAKGIYFVHFQIDGNSAVRKFVRS